MRSAKVRACIFGIVGVCCEGQRVSAQTAEQEPARGRRIVIAASTVLDGRGGVLHDTRIVVEGAKIVAIETKAGPGAAPADYDLRGLTVLPGWIDAHAHITWNFGKDGKNAGMGGTTQEDAYQSASNAWVTLMAGFTTVQSPGAANDIPLRDAIAKGLLAGPRGRRAAVWARREDRDARRNPRVRAKTKGGGSGRDQGLRVAEHPAGRRDDAFAGAIERRLR